MPRRSSPVPTYRLHRPSGQAVVTVPKPGGGRRDVYLGAFDSPESKAEYRRVLAELAIAAEQPATGTTVRPGHRPSVNEVLLAFLGYADGHYRDLDGSPTTEPASYREALRPVRELYGHVPAAEFGPLSLKAVRQKMVESGLSRPVTNARINRVRRVWKWASSEELVPVTTFEALRTVAGLQPGRTTAPEPPPIVPVDVTVVLATLPHLNRFLSAMIRLQLLAGMRPGEAVRFKLADLDRTGEVWEYRPLKHKGRWRGKVRIIPIGPQAQLVLEPFLCDDPAVPLFSPRRARQEQYGAMRTRRKTRVQPSQVDRSKANPLKLPGLHYTVRSYAQAVARAAKKAGVRHWHPLQIRHTAATEVRRQFGLEAAQVLLGHARASTTEIYAETNQKLAARVAAAVG